MEYQSTQLTVKCWPLMKQSASVNRRDTGGDGETRRKAPLQAESKRNLLVTPSSSTVGAVRCLAVFYAADLVAKVISIPW